MADWGQGPAETVTRQKKGRAYERRSLVVTPVGTTFYSSDSSEVPPIYSVC